MRIVGKVVYWLVVVLISLALVIVLILFLESRDQSSIEEARAQRGETPSSVVPRRAASRRISESPGISLPLR
jgi:uncharacterized membrane protein